MVARNDLVSGKSGVAIDRAVLSLLLLRVPELHGMPFSMGAIFGPIMFDSGMLWYWDDKNGSSL